MIRRVDHVVVGGGAMGSATAWQLARRGRSVVLAEQFAPGHVRGSSHGGVRIFRRAYDDPHYVRMAQAAFAEWLALQDDTGEVLFERTGSYDHGAAGSLAAVASAMDAAGEPFELLGAAAAHERVPGMLFDDDVLFHSAAGRVYADRTVAALQRRAGELGAEVRHHCRASVRIVGNHVEADLGGEIVRAGTAIITAGAWVSAVCDGVLPVQAALPPLEVSQEQVAHFTPLDDTAEWPSFIHRADRMYYGLLTPGEGLKIGGHHEGPATTGDERTFELDEARVEAVVRYATRWMPGVDPTPRFATTCLYTSTPTEDFVLDRAGPLIVGSPCSGHGFKFTPHIGRMLADLACSAETIVDPRHRLVPT